MIFCLICIVSSGLYLFVLVLIYVNLWFMLIGSTTYVSFPQNHVVDHEGNGVGEFYLISYDSCATLCDENITYNSFAYCTRFYESEGDCLLNDKILDGSEP